MTPNLRSLLKKGNEFIWMPQHSEDFKAIIKELCSPKLLKYYDSKKKLYLEVDASQKAIGMALLQSVCSEQEQEDQYKSKSHDEHQVETQMNAYKNIQIPDDLLPVAYASKTLTDAETRYANIERELLGVVAGVEKFHTFCYGRSTYVLSDHKPLSSIVRKDLVNAPPRLQ